ncbi:hypothetical protein NAT51_18585 [Flavobacterium amniphilum]|uniref:hypothetical protein n=1 Tax=Flavobacterium amniphilum TaxID=1834035 RepID=UPI00202AAD76|nr:hypothetical protein [Flavobacterium amniphilum]MCL9807537.1 hypothetical protein [Flavobacterium amniphilum]
MKKIVKLTILLLSICASGQIDKNYEKKLNKLIEKRKYWDEESRKSSDLEVYDSLDKYNTEFEKLLLKVTESLPESIKSDFKTLKKNGINILTSKDGNFRIYTWNTLGGGTMQFYRNIFQYKTDGKVYSKANKLDSDESGCNFYELNQVTSKGKTFYITSSIAVFSSSNYYFEAKVFAFDKNKLNTKAKLIKTKSGIKNTLGYEIDLSGTSNENQREDIRDYMNMEYDTKTNTIIIPLLKEDGRITTKKIKYQFKGEYFEKI